MSAKAQFLKKLQDQHPRSTAFDTKAEADIVAFRQRISQLQESMETWLAGAEIRTEATTSTLIEFLISGTAFSGYYPALCAAEHPVYPHFFVRAGRNRLYGSLPVCR